MEPRIHTKPRCHAIRSPPLDTDPWFNAVSLFDKAEPDWHFAVSAFVGTDPSIPDGTFHMAVVTNGTDPWLGNISSIPFPLDTWVRVRLEVGSDRIARLYQDGILVSQHPLGAETLLGTVGGHWGLYAGRDVHDLMVLNDNITLVVYPPASP